MSYRRLSILTWLCVALVVLACCSPAEARRRRRGRRAAAAAKALRAAKARKAVKAGALRRVVVLPFSGPGAAAARLGVVHGLARQAVQLNPGAYQQTARQLGVDPEQPAGIAAVCARLKCDAVVKGSVVKRGRRLVLSVTVHDGGTGDVLGRRTGGARGQRKLAAAGAAAGGQAAGLLTQARRAASPDEGGGAAQQPQPPPPPPDQVAQGQPPAKEPEPEKVPEYKPEPEPAPEPEGRASRSRRQRPGDEETGEGEAEDEEGVTRRASGRSGRSYAGLFEVALAMGLSMRSAQVAIVGSDAEPSKYEGGMYPEFTLRAAFFPLVLATRSFWKNIGLGIAYTRHMTISTKFLDKAGQEQPVDTVSQELLLDLRLRWVLLRRPTSPELTLLAGFGLRDFNLAANAVMPSFNPRFLRFGLEGAVPFGTPYVGAAVGFDARVLLGAGEAVQYLGNRSGGFGFAVRGGLQGKIALGILYFLSVEYLRFGIDFEGLTAAGVTDIGVDPRDRGDPTSVSDQYVRFWVGAGYAY
jgi:hypothetical protein